MSASGKVHIHGSFIDIDPNTGRAVKQGDYTLFEGKFNA